MAASPYQPPTPEEMAASPTLQRYALLAKMAQGAPSEPAQATYPAITQDVAPTQISQQQGASQRGDIIRGADGKLRLVKQSPYQPVQAQQP